MKRDKDILEAVDRFRCLSRDQIAQLYFGHCKKPTTNANMTLKRLRDRGHLSVTPDRQPYIYMPKPSRIKRDSNKIDHFLAITNVYIELMKRGKVKIFEVEPRYAEADVRPDIFTIFKGAPLYIEVQNSVYSSRVMQKKIDLYREYYNSGEYKSLSWQPKSKEAIFPYILLISQTKYNVKANGIDVHQFRDIQEFIASITK